MNLFFLKKNGDEIAKEAIRDFQKGKEEFYVIEKLELALKTGIKKYPKDQIYLHIGACYFDLFLYDKAKIAYEKGLEYNPENSSILSNLGLTIQKMGEFERAIPFYKASLKIKPENSFAHHNIGLYNYENGNYLIAIESLDNAIKFNSSLSVSFAVKARCLAYLGNYIEAEKNLLEAIKRGFDNGKKVKDELDLIKKTNIPVYDSQEKFNTLLNAFPLSKNEIKQIQDCIKSPIDFYNSNKKLFKEVSLIDFEIKNALHLYLMVNILFKKNKMLKIEDNITHKELINKINILIQDFNINPDEIFSEFENLEETNLKELLNNVVAKLKLCYDLELVNIWLNDYELNVFVIQSTFWKELDYPFQKCENGFGKIFSLASKEVIEDWLY